MKNSKKTSHFKIKAKKTDDYLIYLVNDWPHAGRAGANKEPDVARRLYFPRSVTIESDLGKLQP